MIATAQTQFKSGQHVRMIYKNGVVIEGTIAEVKSDRIRAVPFGQTDDGIGFGFALRAISLNVVTVELI